MSRIHSCVSLLSIITLIASSGITFTASAQKIDEDSGHKEQLGDLYMKPGKICISIPSRPMSPSGIQSIQVNVNNNGLNILGDAANEPSIAVDPTNPDNIVIGWRQFDTINSNFRQAGWAYSSDRGQTWTFPGVHEPGVFRSDPVLDADNDGNILYYSLRNDWECHMFISFDKGVTWDGPYPATGGDKAWIAVDKTAGIGEGNIYSAWSTAGNNYWPNQFSRSTNGGTSWMNPIELPSEHPTWGTLAVNQQGDLYVSGSRSGNFYVMKSTNAENAGQTPVFDSIVRVNLGGSIVLGGDPNPEGLLGQSWIATDNSNGSTSGNNYLLCTVDPPGSDPANIMFSRSEDGGDTWSSPLRINDDGNTNAWQWFGTMSVAPNGRIDVIWNDTRESGQSNISRLYYSTSSDGGLTWSANVALSPPFDSHIGWPRQNKLGDYYDMISRNDGAYLAWAATFNGEQDVYFLHIPAVSGGTELVGLDVITGTLLDGGIEELITSDDTYAHTRSGFGQTLVDLHNMEMIVNAVTTVDNASTIDLTIESRIDEPAGSANISLKNFNSGDFDNIGSYSIGNTDQIDVISNVDATNYIDGSGNIELSIKHLVFVPFLAFTFESFIDQVEIVVE